MQVEKARVGEVGQGEPPGDEPKTVTPPEWHARAKLSSQTPETKSKPKLSRFTGVKPFSSPFALKLACTADSKGSKGGKGQWLSAIVEGNTFSREGPCNVGSHWKGGPKCELT